MPHSSTNNGHKAKLIKGKKRIERRREPRKRVKVRVNVSIYESVEEDVKLVQLDADTKDITKKGLGIDIRIRSSLIWKKLSNISLCKELFIDLEFVTPENKIVLSGTIVWCEIINEKKNELRIGIALKEMTKTIREEWNSFFKDTLLTIDK
jgi:hypothetical protein